MPRERPPSAKTLVDRQLGRNVKNPILPTSDGFVVPNHSGDHSAGLVEKTPVNEKDLVNKKYVDGLIRGNVELFLTEDASDIGTYLDLATEETGNAEETIIQAITAGSTTLIGSFASILDESEIDAIAALESGIYGAHIHTSANFPVGMTIYYEFYKRTAGGTETLIGTSHDSDVLSASESQEELHANVSGDLSWTAGDRIVVKVYGRNANAATKNITLFIEGDTLSRVAFPAFIPPTFVGPHATQHETGGSDTVDHDQLLNYVANEHIDWTSTTENLETTGTGVFEGLNPYNNGTADLGSVGFKWRSLFLSEDATVGGNITVGGTVDGVDIAARDHAKYTDAEVDAIVLTHKNLRNAHHAEVHTIVSHFDTTASGTELNTLTDNSMADALHRHSELSASDGTPDATLNIDATGKVVVGTRTADTKFTIQDNTAITSFTLDRTQGLRLEGGGLNEYSLLGFSSSYQSGVRNLGQIGVIFGGGGSEMHFGTSNSYGTGITNTAMEIDPSGNVIMNHELKGTKHSILLTDDTGASSGTTRYIFAGDIQMTSAKGLTMIRSGSITGVSINWDVTYRASGFEIATLLIVKNGATIWSSQIDRTIAQNKKELFAQARGTDTFAAGDTISVAIRIQAGELAYDEVIVMLEFYYND